MHALARPTQIVRLNLDKVIGNCVVGLDSDASAVRLVRLTVPAGVIIALSFEQRPTDIANGVQAYDWPELEGP